MLRKKILAITISTMLSSQVYATGIPVVDVASLTQMVVDGVTRAQEFSESLNEAKNRLNQAKSTATHYKSMVEGHYNYEEILNDPNLNAFVDLTNFQDLYDSIDDVSGLRDEFGMHSDDPVIQRRYDLKLKEYKFQENLLEVSKTRNDRMRTLLTQFNAATTPAAKADLANSIEYEKMQMQNEQEMMGAMNNVLVKQRQLERSKAARENIDKLLSLDI